MLLKINCIVLVYIWLLKYCNSDVISKMYALTSDYQNLKEMLLQTITTGKILLSDMQEEQYINNYETLDHLFDEVAKKMWGLIMTKYGLNYLNTHEWKELGGIRTQWHDFLRQCNKDLDDNGVTRKSTALGINPYLVTCVQQN